MSSEADGSERVWLRISEQRGDNAKVKVQCLKCTTRTNHDILLEQTQNFSSPDGEITWFDTYQMIQCRGCDTISFRQLSATSEEPYNPETDEELITETLYPSRTAGREEMPGGIEYFPLATYRIYREVLAALNHRAPILAAIGLRALIESVCIDQETKTRNLMEGIDELADMGLLSKKQAEFLHAHRFMGNIAAHEMIAPKAIELLAALDIAETLLKTIYILPHTVASIKTGSRRRQPQQQQSSSS